MLMFSFSGSFVGLKGSLQRLQLEYVDIVFANRMDANSPMEGQLPPSRRAVGKGKGTAISATSVCGGKEALPPGLFSK